MIRRSFAFASAHAGRIERRSATWLDDQGAMRPGESASLFLLPRSPLRSIAAERGATIIRAVGTDPEEDPEAVSMRHAEAHVRRVVLTLVPARESDELERSGGKE